MGAVVRWWNPVAIVTGLPGADGPDAAELSSGASAIQDPLTAAAPAEGWAAWSQALLRGGRDRLAGFGLVVVLGFGLGLAALSFFAKLADEVLERETQQLDEAVLAWFRQFASPPLDVTMRAITSLGSEAVAVFLVLLLAYLGIRRRWGAAVGSLLVTVGAQLLNNVLKDLFHRTRPAPVDALIPSQAFSFPSGHVMVAAAFYAFLAYLGWRLFHGWRQRAWVGLLAVLLVLIGISRLYLGVHYLTDVVAGYLAGFIWTDAVILGGHVLGRRAGRRRPVTPSP